MARTETRVPCVSSLHHRPPRESAPLANLRRDRESQARGFHNDMNDTEYAVLGAFGSGLVTKYGGHATRTRTRSSSRSRSRAEAGKVAKRPARKPDAAPASGKPKEGGADPQNRGLPHVRGAFGDPMRKTRAEKRDGSERQGISGRWRGEGVRVRHEEPRPDPVRRSGYQARN